MRSREQIEAKLAALVKKSFELEKSGEIDADAPDRLIQRNMLAIQSLGLEVLLDTRDLLREIREQGKAASE